MTNKEVIKLNTNTLYILSGLTNSGKSFYINELIKEQNLGEECIISPKKIKNMIYGNNDYLIKNLNNEFYNESIKNIVLTMLKERMKEGLMTFFDSSCLTEGVRAEIASYALKENMNVSVIIFDINETRFSYNQDMKKKNSVMYNENYEITLLNKQKEIFQKKSKFDFILFDYDKQDLKVVPNLIDTKNLDLVGDVHGLFEDLKILLGKNNWVYNEKENEFIHNDKNRKILFLGDIIDRGPDSFKILDIVMKMKKDNKCYFLLGNHENKFLNLIDSLKNEEPIIKKSIAGSITLAKFLELENKKQYEYYSFLKNSKSYYNLWINKNTFEVITKNNILDTKLEEKNILKIGFGHGDVRTYNDYFNHKSNILYGSKLLEEKRDNDIHYQKNYDNGINKHIYIRGHYPQKTETRSVLSLDNKCAYAGDIMLLKLNEYLIDLKNNKYELQYELFNKNKITHKINFHFGMYLKTINLENETKIKSSIKI